MHINWKYLLTKPMRFFFLGSGSIMWLGIGLTGFDKAHWLLYIPALFFIFAALTGICPGLIVANKIFKK